MRKMRDMAEKRELKLKRCRGRSSDPKCEANARLIAAAPVLLALIQEYVAQGECEDPAAAYLDYLTRCQTAIAKATKGGE